jgi:hypothetical protein
MSRGQDTRHHENRQVGKDAYSQTATGGSGKKPPKKPGTMTGGPSDKGGYPLGGFSGWFDHAESQDAKMRMNHEEYSKYKGYPKDK